MSAEFARVNDRSGLAHPPVRPVIEKPRPLPIETLSTNEFLEETAHATWRSLEKMINPETGLIADRVDEYGNYSHHTSNTNIGLELMDLEAAAAWGFIDPDKAEEITLKVLRTLDSIEKHNGFLPNWIGTDGSIIRQWQGKDGPEPYTPEISSVDAAWEKTGIILTQKAFEHGSTDRQKEIFELSTSLADAMDFSIFWTPEGGLEITLDFETGMPLKKGTYYRHPSETRLAMYHLALDHGFNDEFTQEYFEDFLSGRLTLNDPGIRTDMKGKMNGNYVNYNGERVIPMPNGTVFEECMPGLVFPDYRGNKDWERSLIAYMRRIPDATYPFTLSGQSSCDDPNIDEEGRPVGYREIGNRALALMNDYRETDTDVITPHAFYLAMMVDPDEAIRNLKLLYKMFGNSDSEDGNRAYNPRTGWADSVDIRTRAVATNKLSLNDAMILAAIANEAHKHGMIPVSPQSHLEKTFGPIREIIQNMKLFYPEFNIEAPVAAVS
ncbi:MAG TPA: DUF3131 domain-containing protein [Patescibacteria group bacterium]|nr:DUF3131 domain-containing protein [Patescibacteria group bacterium]